MLRLDHFICSKALQQKLIWFKIKMHFYTNLIYTDYYQIEIYFLHLAKITVKIDVRRLLVYINGPKSEKKDTNPRVMLAFLVTDH